MSKTVVLHKRRRQASQVARRDHFESSGEKGRQERKKGHVKEMKFLLGYREV